jgi:hypothetical protein
LFATFKKRNLVEVHGASVIIKDRGGLEELMEA